MEAPIFTDYVTLIFNLFERFVQERGSEMGWCSDRYDYDHKTLNACHAAQHQTQYKYVDWAHVYAWITLSFWATITPTHQPVKHLQATPTCPRRRQASDESPTP